MDTENNTLATLEVSAEGTSANVSSGTEDYGDGAAGGEATETRTRGEEMLYDVFRSQVKEEPEETEDGTESAETQEDAASQGQDGAKNTGYSEEDFQNLKRDTEAEINRRLEEYKVAQQKELDTEIAGIGITDPYTGKLIQSRDDLKAYAKSAQENYVQEAASNAGMSKEQFEELVSKHPDVQNARAERAQLEAERQKAQMEQARARLDNDIAEITKMNPDIKSFDDLRKLDKFSDIYDLIKNNYRPQHAYQIVYADKLIEQRIAAAEQTARNNVQGKSHLTKAETTGDGNKELSPEEMSIARFLNPGMSDKEIRKRAVKLMKK